ncbi:disulfide bond formation protein B [Parvularcula maris]|uniref:Disulfide bond formation protein B n=1 Tax=Parvularcula maris TaxID=2965077 RepID=A0A9X2L706_9PROT|nr:disulfide bond formation protein B [Parvularcula maris]MCQ8184324.1 disulfide bond formation protein B [Parvularcula maris]
MVTRLDSLAEPQNALVICAVGSGALLAGAHLFEHVGGMAPCLLCLDQREAHWAALALSLIAVPFILWRKNEFRVSAAALGALVLIYAFSAILASYHAGVEWKFWPGPDTCAASPENVDLDLLRDGALFENLDGPSSDGPPCNEAAWRLLGVSMAGYNALISLALTLLAGMSCARAARELRDDRVGGVLTAD